MELFKELLNQEDKKVKTVNASAESINFKDLLKDNLKYTKDSSNLNPFNEKAFEAIKVLEEVSGREVLYNKENYKIVNRTTKRPEKVDKSYRSLWNFYKDGVEFDSGFLGNIVEGLQSDLMDSFFKKKKKVVKEDVPTKVEDIKNYQEVLADIELDKNGYIENVLEKENFSPLKKDEKGVLTNDEKEALKIPLVLKYEKKEDDKIAGDIKVLNLSENKGFQINGANTKDDFTRSDASYKNLFVNSDLAKVSLFKKGFIDGDPLKIQQLGGYIDSKWMIFLEVPEKNKEFVPSPPYSQEDSLYKKTRNFSNAQKKLKYDYFNYGTSGFIPTVGTFELGLEELQKEELTIGGSYGISIPSQQKYKRTLTFNVLNDEFNTVYDYMIDYKNGIYRDFKTVVPYKNSVTIIKLIIYNKQWNQAYLYELLGILKIDEVKVKGNYKFGGESAVLSLSWDIVGELRNGEFNDKTIW